jgi:hypothetical protein
LQTKALIHEALQTGAIDQIVGELLVGKKTERGAAGVGCHFGCFFNGEIGILADHRHDHAHHDLKAAEPAAFLNVIVLTILVGSINSHTLPPGPGNANRGTNGVLFGCGLGPTRFALVANCAILAGQCKLPLALNLGDAQDSAVVTAVIC